MGAVFPEDEGIAVVPYTEVVSTIEVDEVAYIHTKEWKCVREVKEDTAGRITTLTKISLSLMALVLLWAIVMHICVPVCCKKKDDGHGHGHDHGHGHGKKEEHHHHDEEKETEDEKAKLVEHSHDHHEGGFKQPLI